MSDFKPKGLPLLIGSLPLKDHQEALKLVLAHTPDIPLWVQLPMNENEGMVEQFVPGLPGLTAAADGLYLDVSGQDFDDELVRFYEEYLAVAEGRTDLSDSRFCLTADRAQGFFTLYEHLRNNPTRVSAVKGQITGPFTFCTGLHDQNKRAVFYNDQLKDAAIKLIALKAAWQVKRLSAFNRPVILFIDEPALAGFGSSEFIAVSRDDVVRSLDEVIGAVRSQGGLTGIHVCANTDWSVLFDSSVDIISFDAYTYFDRFILYGDRIRQFLQSGRLLAWGIVPTLNGDDIESATIDSLWADWKGKAEQVTALGVDMSTVVDRSLITPSCGTGSITLKHAVKVMDLTKEVSKRIQKTYLNQ